MNEQSLKEKLRSIANKQGRTFQETWKKLILERFLARVSKSKYVDQFIFKGGLLLSYYLEIGRETKDIDFLARNISPDENTLKSRLTEICSEFIDDGFSFSFAKIDLLEHTHMNYPGYRIKLNVSFNSMSDMIQLDIGIGDTVEPVSLKVNSLKYKEDSLFKDEITLKVYPLTFIFAEKLETLVYRGSANSRMKDYHDLFYLSLSELLEYRSLKKNIESTFAHRETDLKSPIQYSQSELEKLQSLWSNHLKGLNENQLPKEIKDVIDKINDTLDRAFA